MSDTQPVESLTVQVRRNISWVRIARTVERLGTGEIFFQSQSWEGYEKACESSHEAYWRWIDSETPQSVAAKVRRLKINWKDAPPMSEWPPAPSLIREKLPTDEEQIHAVVEEAARQEYLVERADFLLGIRGTEGCEASFYPQFLKPMELAGIIGDGTFFEHLAKRKQQKPSIDKGDRRLRYQLLLCWVPACLWAFATEGVAAFLASQYPRTGGKAYDPTTISDARRDLRLFRSSKPLWWGMSGTPLKLQPVS